MAQYFKTQQTRERLMLAAENLIGRHGIGGASAREIAKAANLRNNCSVQYHFESLDGLLEALVRFRMSHLDSVRAAMIDADGFPEGQPDFLTLMRVVCLPHLSIKATDGSYSYAAFLCQYLPIYHPMGFRWLMRSAGPDMPAIRWTIRELRAGLPQLSPDMFDRRLTSASLLFLNVLQGLSRGGGNEPVAPDDDIIMDAVRQSVSVLTAPTADPPLVNLAYFLAD